MIRYLISSDIDRFNELYKYFSTDLLTYNEVINHPFNKYLVYLLDDNIVGFLVFSIIYDRSELNYIYILDNYRNNGYSKELMNFYIDECIKNNVLSITLEVREDNLRAINLYKGCGFSIVSIRYNYYGDTNGLLMLKNLGD